MAGKKRAETLLNEAIEAEDNLAILKAHRKILVKDLIACDEPSDRVKLSTVLTQINKEIIKLEGSKEVKNDELETALAEDEQIRNMRGLK